jgi:hypothetical protein
MSPFFAWVETSALSVWVRESTSVFAFPTILSLHTIGMGFVAGLSTAIALRMLGIASGVPLKEARRLVPLIWAAFWLNAVSGVILLIGYPTKALTNPLFYFKLFFVALAVWAFRQISKRIALGGDGDRRLAAWLIVCWVVAITAGRLLAYTYSKLTTI